MVLNFVFWVQRFRFRLMCYGFWLTHAFGFVSYSDPFRIKIRGGEGKDKLSMGSTEVYPYTEHEGYQLELEYCLGGD